MNFSSSGGDPLFQRRYPNTWSWLDWLQAIWLRVANGHNSDDRHTVPGLNAAVVESLAPTKQEADNDNSRYCCNFDASLGIMLSDLIAACYSCHCI